MRSIFITWTVWFTVSACYFGVANGQDFPSKPIRIVAAEAGAGNDFTARLIAQGLTGYLGQQVLVENRGSGGGIIAAQTVARAAPDGHTLLLYGSNIWLLPFMQDNLPYDPVRDLAPITLAVSSPNILVVHPSLTAASVQDLIALAKKRPGDLNYASAATGAAPHLAAELFKSMAGVNIVRVNYKGTAPALNDLISGQVQVMFPSSGSVTGHIKSARLRALAITTGKPSALFPALPTVAEAGVPGYAMETIYGIWAPARTPEAIIKLLNQEIVRVLAQAEAKERFLKVGIETIGSTPEQFAATIKADMNRLGAVIRNAGISAE